MPEQPPQARDGNISPEDSFEPGSAAVSELSLAQAILAPVDAILKAQVHATRSFLNMLLQLGTPHQVLNSEGKPVQDDDGLPYDMEFTIQQESDGKQSVSRVKIPTLALVPLNPLAVSKGRFQFSMSIRRLTLFRQMAKSKDSVRQEGSATPRDDPAYHRPWHLVGNPVSIVGALSSTPGGTGNSQQSDESASIQVEVEVGPVPVPESLDRLFSALGKPAVLTGPKPAKQ